MFRRKLRFFLLRSLRIVQFLGVVLIISLVIWSAWLDKQNIVTNYIEGQIKSIMLDAGLAIQQIEISGNEKVSNNEILRAMLRNELEDISQYPIVMLSAEQVKNNLVDVTWIEDITITKKLPGTVIINIAERKPVALWQNNKQIWVADKKGNLLTEDIGSYRNLPLIVGKNRDEDIKEVFDIMKASEYLAEKVESFTKIGERRWDVRFINGTILKLPEKLPVKAWKKLEEFEQEKSILSKNINYIDMRIEGQLIVGL